MLLFTGILNYINQYRGRNRFHCNLCQLDLSFFLHTSNHNGIIFNSICPHCSGRKRHRGLYELYNIILKEILNPNILHFAPEPVFYKLFDSYNYIKADLDLLDVDLKLDIQNIDCDDNSYDLILSNHVLEHVLDDMKALNELYRILKPKGLAIITVPGNWKRKETIKFSIPKYNGHYRDYGLSFITEIEKIFYQVESIDLYKYNNNYRLPIGLTCKHDLAFICQKK